MNTPENSRKFDTYLNSMRALNVVVDELQIVW